MDNFMECIGKTVANTCYSASKESKKVAKGIKLKSKIMDKKREIQELYEDIGKSAYERYVLKQDINIEDIRESCSKIDSLANEVEEMGKELLKLKDLKKCPNCHYEIYYEFDYCPNCGCNQKDESTTEKQEKPNHTEKHDEEKVEENNHQNEDSEKQNRSKNKDDKNNENNK